jgi:hypothetical protein
MRHGDERRARLGAIRSRHVGNHVSQFHDHIFKLVAAQSFRPPETRRWICRNASPGANNYKALNPVRCAKGHFK